ncbi:serine hydrolase domain-containing protein [Brevundimonas sp.]|uniref:serine hydrolase domain-containing protein n=1 Tax=Brevundimonas sp. TaxID=1871086 RepID=UPI002D355749|nr:serine hydrolase domain-containing protein [Brevundimonas sp.]HYD27918.1 serine hydrolase domain-containing protein [Brevundimonas sp.]
MIASRRTLLAGLAALPLAAVPRFARAQEPGAAAEAALDAAFAEGPPGLAAAIVTRDGVTWSGVRGVRRAGHEAKATLEDRWHLGSNTKAMTAAVFGRLVDQGRARWDMPLAEALPGLTMDTAWAGATLDQLMRHRAGLLDAGLLDQAWLIGAHADQRPLPEQRAAFAARALASPPAGPVGQFSYGNGNYIVLGAAIEALTGQAWEAAMEAELYAPLGLDSAGFGAPRGEAPWGHRGGVGIDPTGFADNPRALGPAGTAHMSLSDYSRFVSAMMGGAPGWLGDETRRRLLTPAAGSPPAYAAGWGVGSAPWAGVGGPGPTISHNGSNTMWFATVLAAPERGLGFIALSNDGAAGQRACQTLVRRLAEAATAA